MATIGLLSDWLPADPANLASPKEKTPPSDATIQYPCPMTRKHPLQVTEPPSLRLVTVTSRAPGGASEAKARLASSRVSDTTAMGPSVTPVPETVIWALGRKLMPSMPSTSPEVSWRRSVGVTVAIFGPDCTVNRTTSSPSVGGDGVPSSLVASTCASSSALSCQGAGGPVQVALSWSPSPTMATGFLASSQTQARFVPRSLCTPVRMAQVASPGRLLQVRLASRVLRLLSALPARTEPWK